MRWFRFYEESLDNMKVQSLPADLFKFWVNILCVASRCEGTLPVTSHCDKSLSQCDKPASHCDEIAFYLRMNSGEVAEKLKLLIKAELIDEDAELKPHNWDKRQYKSDTSAERTRKYREKKKANHNNKCDVTNKVTVTPSEADTESDTDTDKNTVVSSEPNGSSDTTCLQSSAEELQTATSNEISEAGTDPPSKIDNCPHQAIIDLYHKHIPGGTKVRIWSEDSRKKLRRRWREEAERQSLEWWDKFFYNVSQLDFFMGRTEIDYQTNLDALVSPKMFNRIISDHYWQIQQKKQKTKKY